ncbi:MAG: hypothetical protein U9R25_05275 [Chloroflexota bacterium]|nr:hypothetical protein [Chloroflexota bacterium]
MAYLSNSDILMYSYDNFHIHLDEDDTNSAFVIYSGSGTNLWSISESGLAVAHQGSALAIDAGTEGQQLVYPVHSPQNWPTADD